MFQVPSLVVLLGLTLCILASRQAMAQQFSESDVVYEAARNKIGLIRYCRNNGLLDPAIATQAVAAVETGLRKLPPGNALSREQGDRAQRAGEAGFWEAGRRRDIGSVAKLFRTTPADLCQEWADETLRAQAPRRRGKVTTTIAVIAPIQQVDRRPARANAVARAAPSDPLPPLPERAPFLRTRAEPAALPTVGNLASTGKAEPGHKSGTTALAPSALSRSSGQAAPLSARSAVTAAAPSGRVADRSHPFWGKWPFNRLGKSQRCLMPGCRWPGPQGRHSGR
jgi:hypothetical protein